MNGMKLLRRILAILVLFASAATAVEPLAVPRVEDPTPIIDADLGDWEHRGAVTVINTAEHATYRKSLWRGPEDAGAEVRMGYDSKHLYFAARVTDDVVSQTQSGTNLWRGDHLLVLLDFAQTGDDKELIQLGLSPGNLDAPTRTRPEIYAWRPEGLTITGAAIAVQRTVEGRESRYAREVVVNAARAAGLQAIDTVHSDVSDPAGLADAVREARGLGFEGKGCIHPRQIAVVHEAFLPTEEEVSRACAVVGAFRVAEEEGLGVVILGSKMIDPPVVKRALKTVEQALQGGMLDPDWMDQEGEA